MDSLHERSIVVNGDAAIEWQIITGNSSWDESSSFRNFSEIRSQPGGVGILNLLINELVRQKNAKNQIPLWRNYSLLVPFSDFHPSDLRITHSFTQAKYYGSKPAPAWRISERFGTQIATSNEIQSWQKIENEPDDPDLIILHDSNLGFRNNKDLWPKALFGQGKTPWIILKMAKPVMEENLLFDLIQKNFSEKCIVVISADDLRKTAVQISCNLSWERTAQDVIWELIYNPKMNKLATCAHVIITFQNAGAVIISKSDDGKKLPKCHLFFDSKHSEGSWDQSYPGMMTGYQSCFIAGLANQYLSDTPDILNGVQAGLSAMRTLHLNGYEDKNENKSHARFGFTNQKNSY